MIHEFYLSLSNYIIARQQKYSHSTWIHGAWFHDSKSDFFLRTVNFIILSSIIFLFIFQLPPRCSQNTRFVPAYACKQETAIQS